MDRNRSSCERCRSWPRRSKVLQKLVILMSWWLRFAHASARAISVNAHPSLFAGLLQMFLNTLVLRTPEEGAETLVSRAVLGRESHGRWYDHELPVHNLWYSGILVKCLNRFCQTCAFLNTGVSELAQLIERLMLRWSSFRASWTAVF